MSALTKLGIALTAVFAVSVVVLVAQIAWVLWRRNRFLSNNGGHGCVHGGDIEGDASGGAFREPVKATKELLYFFCWKDSQSSSRVKPDGRAVTEGASEDSDEALKWQAMYRESRMLYTIKEEEKEGEAAGESDRDGNSSGGGRLTPEAEGKDEEKKEEKGRRVCLKECLEAKEEDSSGHKTVVVAGKAVEESAMEFTPFSTPCGSPDRYFTPSPSPPRAEQDGMYADYAKMAALC